LLSVFCGDIGALKSLYFADQTKFSEATDIFSNQMAQECKIGLFSALVCIVIDFPPCTKKKIVYFGFIFFDFAFALAKIIPLGCFACSGLSSGYRARQHSTFAKE